MQMEKEVKWKAMKKSKMWFPERRVRKKYRAWVMDGIRDTWQMMESWQKEVGRERL